MRKAFLKIGLAVIGLYLLICGFLYFIQEKLIFFPTRLDKEHVFHFEGNFEEVSVKTDDGVMLNALLFKADSALGVIFYLHGNAGSNDTWGNVAETYTDLNFDVLLLDYRGYGKSEGSIKGQSRLYKDNQVVYDFLKTKYSEEKIIVLGYSIGSGPSAKLASDNHPKLLILQAPYYSLVDMLRNNFPLIPAFILKYKFQTNQYVKDCSMPVIIFHGDQDEVIYYGSSLKLESEFKSQDTLITLHGQGHNGMTNNGDYIAAIQKILVE
jgi:pimeloyl-ACP methyl ester carboxylesterase